MKVGRREFLLSTAGLLLPSIRVKASGKAKILVLGAGISGLSAAYELAQRGFEVKVIEARKVAGGRVFTLRQPFLEGQYVELGGEIIGDGYKRFLGYAKKFGVPFAEISPSVETGGTVATLQRGIGTSAIIKGKLYPVGSKLDQNPYNLPSSEANELPPTLLAKHLATVVNEIIQQKTTLTELDKLSLAQLLRLGGVSEQMIKLMDISLNYNSIETVSAACVLWDMKRRFNAGSKPIKIIGGNDLLIKALLENSVKSGVEFIFDAEIKQISQNEKFARVNFRKNGSNQSIEADLIVCTIPFSVLREIKFDASLPESKAKAINELTYTRITKVFLQAERENWDSRNLGSAIWTDTPCERIFSAAGKKGDRLGIFTIWAEGKGASIPESLNDKRRIRWAEREFVKALPFMKDKILRGATKSWTLDPYARGAYMHFRVGQMTTIKPLLKMPVGRIHFAGEHTADNYPGMEGALESAERVIEEIFEIRI